MLDVAAAKKELSEKTLDQIQRETAWKWASRAAASFENVLEADREKKVSLYMAGAEYLHEAIEHASLVYDGDGALVDDIRLAVAEAAVAAVVDIDESLDIDL